MPKTCEEVVSIDGCSVLITNLKKYSCLTLLQIKKSMAVTHDVGNPKTPASATGQASANPKLHSAKPPAMPSPKAREPP